MRTLALVCLALLNAPAVHAKALRTAQGVTVRWEMKDIHVGIDVTRRSAYLAADVVEAALDGARGVWNELPEMRRTKLAPLTTAARPEITVRFCRSGWKDERGTLGSTEFVADPKTGVIRSAVIEINECDFEFLGPDEVTDGKFDLQSVIAHELGHALGLAHSTDPTAIMFTSTGNARQLRPGLDDRAGLAELFQLPPPSRIPVAVLPATPAPKPSTRFSIPPDVLTAVRLESGKGGMIYTCEPTILPAMDTPAPARKATSGRASSRRSSEAPR
jgi:hypothetical protein